LLRLDLKLWAMPTLQLQLPLYLEQIQAAKQEGKQQQQEEIAVNLIRKNIPLEVISETTGVSIDRLQTLRSQLPDS
jgi:hypothetical protein